MPLGRKFMFAYYESVADARGEGVIDAFWAIPFDAALLTSCISLNRYVGIIKHSCWCTRLYRKEIQTSYTSSAKFDVVFTFRKRHLKEDDIPLGVMEIKPPRYNTDAKAASKDYLKVINALYRLLENIVERIQDWACMAEIVVVGVVCHGIPLPCCVHWVIQLPIQSPTNFTLFEHRFHYESDPGQTSRIWLLPV